MDIERPEILRNFGAFHFTPTMNKKQLAIKILGNKYFITTVAFLVWITYFDQNDWLTLQLKKKELNGVKSDITYLNNEIAEMEQEKNDLQSAPAAIERYSRETYRMKRDGEDVYVIDKK